MRTIYLDHEAATIDFLVIAQRSGDLPPPCLLVLVADDCARLVLPIAVDEVPADPPQDERLDVLGALFGHLADIDRAQGVAMAVGRLGHPSPRGGDFGWHDALAQCSRSAGLNCYGTYVATPYAVRRVRPLLSPEMPAA